MKTGLLIGGGVILIGGIAYYLYSKKKATAAAAAQAALPSAQVDQGLPALSPSSPSSPSPAAPVAIKQTMWKDVDGNIFEMTTTKERWGYVIKVNGAVQGKMNQAEVMTLGPDGHAVHADNNGSLYVFNRGGWQNVIRDNKASVTEYLAKLGIRYPTGAFAGFSGLGNAYALQ